MKGEASIADARVNVQSRGYWPGSSLEDPHPVRKRYLPLWVQSEATRRLALRPCKRGTYYHLADGELSGCAALARALACHWDKRFRGHTCDQRYRKASSGSRNRVFTRGIAGSAARRPSHPESRPCNSSPNAGVCWLPRGRFTSKNSTTVNRLQISVACEQQARIQHKLLADSSIVAETRGECRHPPSRPPVSLTDARNPTS